MATDRAVTGDTSTEIMYSTQFRIISVDPAPGKPSTLYDSSDQKFRHLSPAALDTYLIKARNETERLLLVWDAPLTGPPSTDRIAECQNAGDPNPYYMRRLEQRLRARYSQLVNILGYAGCSHWAISRAVLGLPKVGRYCSDCIPFRHVVKNDRPVELGHYVVETHPALAAAMLDTSVTDLLREYKGSRVSAETRKDATRKLFEHLKSWCEQHHPEIIPTLPQEVTGDDEFDALVGYVIATVWINGGNSVEVVGNQADGAMLLPHIE